MHYNVSNYSLDISNITLSSPYSTMPLCEGCFSEFTRDGYTRHIAQSNSPACQAQLDSYHRGAQVSDDEDESDDDDDDVPARPFTGDFFGVYDLMEVDGDEGEEEQGGGDVAPEDSDREDEESVGSVVDDELDEALRPHWEAPSLPIQPSAHNDSVPVTPSISENVSDDRNTAHTFASQPRKRFESALRQEIHREHITAHFPRAGEKLAVSQREDMPDEPADNSSDPRAYRLYEALLATQGILDQNNTYSPFVSKLDYEVGKWGKTRGLSSTALAELLSIDGVSPDSSMA